MKTGRKAKNPFIDISKKCGIKPFDMEEIVVENLELTNIEPDQLKLFPNLQVIYLNNNKLTKLDNLNFCIRLEIIDARDNQISHIHLPKQSFLKELYLANNNFTDVDLFIEEASNLRNLEILDLRNNLLTQVRGYRQMIISKFQSLKVLDGLEVLVSERQKANLQKSDKASTTKTKRRPCSMLDFLKSAPLSEPDKEVIKKSEHIRKLMEKKRKEEEEEQTKAARLQREEFEAKNKINDIPIPEGLDFLGKTKKLIIQDVPKKQNRARSRMYIKTTTFAEIDPILEPDDKEDKFVLLNPNIPKAAMDHVLKTQFVYPE